MIKKIISILFLVFISCQESTKNTDSDFTLIERGGYFLDSHKGISIYRLNKTREVMDGYYIVGSDLKKWEEFNLKKGKLNGNHITYHNNGSKASKGIYINGILHGAEESYYLSGKLKSKSNYLKGVLEGEKIDYYESGQMMTKSMFIDNKLEESTSYTLIGNIVSQTFLKDGRKITQRIVEGKLFSEEISSTYDNYEAMKFYNQDGSLKLFMKMEDDGDNHFLIELDKDGNEIKRIDVKKNPSEAMKYAKYFNAN